MQHDSRESQEAKIDECNQSSNTSKQITLTTQQAAQRIAALTDIMQHLEVINAFVAVTDLLIIGK